MTVTKHDHEVVGLNENSIAKIKQAIEDYRDGIKKKENNLNGKNEPDQIEKNKPDQIEKNKPEKLEENKPVKIEKNKPEKIEKNKPEIIEKKNPEKIEKKPDKKEENKKIKKVTFSDDDLITIEYAENDYPTNLNIYTNKHEKIEFNNKKKYTELYFKENFRIL